jgi:hypothetical protein
MYGMVAWEAIAPATSAQRKALICDELLAYCALDTRAMVEIWKKFSQNRLASPPQTTPKEKKLCQSNPKRLPNLQAVPRSLRHSCSI